MSKAESSARWFLARSDVEAVLRLWSTGRAPDWANPYIHKYWPQVFDDEQYKRVYSEAGPIEAAVPDVFENVRYAWRLQMARAFLASAPDGLKAIDFGCSKAYYSAHLHNDTPVKRWLCVDIDEASIGAAYKQVQANAKDPSKFSYLAGTEDDIMLDDYRVALLFEVLEHVRDPQKVLATIESKLAPESYVLISLPSGPVEYSMWVEHPERNREHIREYTLDDINEVFGGKPELRVQYISYGPSRYLPAMLEGCFFVTYKRNGQPIGTVDWARKLSGVRPDVALPGL